MSILNDDESRELGFDIAMSLLQELFLDVKPDECANISSSEYLAWMATEISCHAATMDADKMHRWIGYIQGVAIVTSLTNLDQERERVALLRRNILARHQ